MSERPVYSREEAATLRDTVRSGLDPICPRCDERLRAREIRPSEEVSYVRLRVWWFCETCGRSVVVDRAR